MVLSPSKEENFQMDQSHMIRQLQRLGMLLRFLDPGTQKGLVQGIRDIEIMLYARLSKNRGDLSRAK